MCVIKMGSVSGSGGSSNSTIHDRSASLLAGVAAAIMIVIVAAAYPGHSLASPQLSAAGGMQNNNNDDNNIKFTSLSAYDSNHGYLGQIKDNKIFKSGEPVFIQANFTNPGDPAGNNNNYLVIIEVRNGDTSETVALSSVQAKFAGAGNNLAVETYWKPLDQKASHQYYTILVFLQKLEDLNKTPIQPPVVSARVQVV